MDSPTRYDLALANVSFAYQKATVLDNVSFKIEHHDFATIVGPNGGGKTTMLKLFLGLIQPEQGSIEILGRSPRKSRKSIGYMPQYMNFDMSFPITVLDLVLMGRLGNGFPGKYSPKDREIARHALEEVLLADLAQKQIGRAHV